MFIDTGMDKENVLCMYIYVIYIYIHIRTHHGYYPAIKKHEIMPSAATRTPLEIVILTEVRQKEKYMTSLKCGI